MQSTISTKLLRNRHIAAVSEKRYGTGGRCNFVKEIRNIVNILFISEHGNMVYNFIKLMYIIL